MNKNNARLRRARSTRAHIRELGVPRLSVLRTGQHLYAQVFSADGSELATVNCSARKMLPDQSQRFVCPGLSAAMPEEIRTSLRTYSSSSRGSASRGKTSIPFEVMRYACAPDDAEPPRSGVSRKRSDIPRLDRLQGEIDRPGPVS